MKDFVDHALNVAMLKSARYADIRIIDRREQVVSVKNGNVDGIGQQDSQGFGVRVLVNNSWGFASSAYLDKAEIERVTSLAVQIAKASSIVAGEAVDLGDRAFEVVHTPGHSPGGIALWERKTGTLLSGDIIYDGPLIDDCYHSDLGDYETSLRRLAKLPAQAVHGGHFPSFGGKRLIEVIDEYLIGRRLPGCHLDR